MAGSNFGASDTSNGRQLNPLKPGLLSASDVTSDLVAVLQDRSDVRKV